MSTMLATTTNGSRLARFLNEDWPFPQLFEGMRGFDPQLRVEEHLEGDTLLIRAEAPGIDPEKDVDVTINDGVLQISVERRDSSTSEAGATRHSEFRYGSFQRRLRLPKGTKDDDVKASYKDGILEIRVPTGNPEIEEKKVPISRG